MKPMVLVCDQNGFITPLKKVAGLIVAAVEVGSVSRIYPLHGIGQISVWRLEEHVVMVRHQAKGQKTDVEALTGAGKEVKEVLAVLVIEKNILPVIAP
jgi:dTDP-4-dehydrorhamnose reductase